MMTEMLKFHNQSLTTTCTAIKNCMRHSHSFFCAGIEPGHAGEGRQVQRKGRLFSSNGLG